MGRQERMALKRDRLAQQNGKSNGAASNGASQEQATQPEIETRPLGELTALAVEQYYQVQNAAMSRLVTTCARAEGLRLEDGWQLDPQNARWVRKREAKKPKGDRPDRARKDKPETLEPGSTTGETAGTILDGNSVGNNDGITG